MNFSLVPLLGGPHGPWTGGGPFHGPGFFHPFLGGLMFLLFALLVLGGLMLARSGKLGPVPGWVGRPHHSPEFEARKILAERFAQGELSSDEFLERASVLNWTPGSDAFPPGKPKKKR